MCDLSVFMMSKYAENLGNKCLTDIFFIVSVNVAYELMEIYHVIKTDV